MKLRNYVILILVLIGGLEMNAQVTAVDFQLRYDTVMCRHDAYFIAKAGNATSSVHRTQFNAQYSLVVPTGSAVGDIVDHAPYIGNFVSGTGTTPMDWTITTVVFAPAAAPESDFYSITPTLSPTARHNNITEGDTIKLFSVAVTPIPDCGEGIRIFENETIDNIPFNQGGVANPNADPNSSAPGMGGADFSNGFTIGSTSGVYQNNEDPVNPPVPELSAEAMCASGLEIDLSATTSLCQAPLTYQWNGPNGYSSTDEDVAINPAGGINNGTYTVVVTDNFGCTETLDIEAISKPDAGADITACAGESATLMGTEPTTGTWSADPTNGSGASITPGSGGAATVDFDAAATGSYNFIYTNATCADTVAVSISSQDAGPDPSNVGCFSTGTAALAGVGTGTWTIDPSSPGTADIADASSPTTTVTNFSAPGTYILVWTENGCSDSVTLIVNDQCDCAIASNTVAPPNPSSFCGSSGNVTLDGATASPAGGTYAWEYSLNGGAFAAAPASNTAEDYTTNDLSVGMHTFRRIYTVTTGLACSDTSNIASFTVNTQPGAPLNGQANPNPICLSESTTLSVDNLTGATYNWTTSDADAGLGSSTTNTISMTPTAVGTYDVFVTQTLDGCESTPTQITVTVDPTPPTPTSVVGTDPTACEATDGTISLSVLTANTPYTVSYSLNGSTASSSGTSDGAGTLVLMGLAAGSYSNFIVSNSAGCTSDAVAGPVLLMEPNAPDAPTGITVESTPECEGTPVTITVDNNPAATYTWSASSPNAGLGTSTDSINVMSALAPGQYTISVTQTVAGCESPPASIGVEINGVPPTPTAASVNGNNPSSCGGTDGSITLSGLESSVTYTVDYNVDGVPAMFTTQTDGSGVFTIPNLSEGTYTDFQLSNFAGCTSGVYMGPVSLSDPGAPDAPANLSALPNPICVGETVALSVTDNPLATFNWSANSPDAGLGTSTTNNNSMTPTTAGVYTVSVSQTIAGCTSPSSTVEVTVLDTPPAINPNDITSTDPSVCSGMDGSISIAGLDASTPYTITYTFGGSSVDTPITTDASGVALITGLLAGSYTDFVITNAGNCSSPVFPGPISLVDPDSPDAPADITADPNPVCIGEAVTLSVTDNPAATYNWTVSPSTAGTISGNSSTEVFTPTASGNYVINVTQTVAGCTSPSAMITVFVNELPPSLDETNFTANSPSVCTGEDGSIDISGLEPSTGYFLTYDSLGTVVTLNIMSDASGTYQIMNLGSGNYTSFELVSLIGCSSGVYPGPVSISDPGAPDAPGNLTADPNPACLGETINLSVDDNPGAEFTWSISSPDGGLVTTTSNTTTMTPTVAGTYTVSVFQTLADCVSPTSSIDVVVTDIPPTPDVNSVNANDPTTCGVDDGSITFSGLIPGETYTLGYELNGSPVNMVLVADASGVITLDNLGLGMYGNFVIVSSNGCASGVYVGPIELMGPEAPPAPTGLMGVPIPVCLSGVVNLSVDNNPDATYAWTASSPNAGLQMSTTNTNSMIATAAGTYTISVSQTVNGCTSPLASMDVVVNAGPPTPTASTVQGSNPSACLATDGFITLSGLSPNTTYTVNYALNGDPVMTMLTTDGNGMITISALGAGNYADFQLISGEGCASGVYSGPIVLTEPDAPDAPTGLSAIPNPVCLGNTVSLNASGLPGATFNWSISDSQGGIGNSTTSTNTMNPTTAGTYTILLTQTISGCTSAPATVDVLVLNDCYNPDFGVTYATVPLTGVLSTNDDAQAGTSYGTVTADAGNPDVCAPVVSSLGTYSFDCTTDGEYNYTVEVCPPSSTDPCTQVPLVITVLDSTSSENPPVINHDYIATNMNTPIGIEVYDNDKCQSSPSCTLGDVTLISGPFGGNFNTSTLSYLPQSGFMGVDSFLYELCQSPATPENCDQEWVYINVFPGFATAYTNAMDDYNQTPMNTELVISAGAGLLSNDMDPQGSAQTIDGFTSTEPGKGTLALSSDGSYVFTPATDFVGPVDFAYQVCRTANNALCDSATLHLLVSPALDAGNIGSIVWLDENGNGVYEPGSEIGIPDVPVTLFDSEFNEIASTITDAAGNYFFEAVIPGSYFLEFEQPDGLEVTIPNVGTELNDSDVDDTFGTGTTDLFMIEAGEDIEYIKAGYFECVLVGDNVWYDVNMNDVFDDSENGINGLVVELWRNVNGSYELWETTTTGKKPNSPSDDGWYNFCVAPGTYYIRIALPPSGLVQARPFVGNNSFRDSDINNGNGAGTTNSFTLTAGNPKLDLGAGYYPEAIAGNLVWLDENGDGIQNSFEARVEGVLVEAYDVNTGSKLGEGMSNANGVYKIDNLEKKDIYFKFYPPNGMLPTYHNDDYDDLNSDVDDSYGENTTRMFSMIPDNTNNHIDLGLAFGILPVSWLDIQVEKAGNSHFVSWSVADQVNVQEYEVERMVEGEQFFTKISTEKIDVKEGIIVDYSFVDRDLGFEGQYFYRIKQLDIDGRYSFSDIVTIENKGGNNGFKIYPNPTTEVYTIEVLNNGYKTAVLEIFDDKGKLVSRESRSGLAEGTNILKGNLSSLNSGVYTLVVKVGSDEYIQKIVKVE